VNAAPSTATLYEHEPMHQAMQSRVSATHNDFMAQGVLLLRTDTSAGVGDGGTVHTWYGIETKESNGIVRGRKA
jgi:hypothetical protein